MSAGRTVDLVADVGESFGAHRIGDDERILRVVTSANVACGFHAGDPRTMTASVAACVANDVAIGAHPGFPDLVGFGRRAMELSRDEVRTDVVYQIGALDGFARAAGSRVRHVCPHGRLGTLVATDREHALGVADAVEEYDADLTVYTLPGELEREARARGLPVAVIGLVDRAFEDDGSVVSRREAGAVLHEPDVIVERALSMAVDGTVLSRNGKRVDMACDTLLMHGDNAASISAAELVRAALEDAGVTLAAFTAR
jgi:5-oxoprolinase (ATP-hydrolysing) subunit A